jgi:two-component system cell cycle sensor histidine kinase PleC
LPVRAFNMTRKKSSLLGRYSTDLGRLISRQRAETALRTAAIESALANKAKSAFLATMSHELRTPLNAIIGFSDLLKQSDKIAISPEQAVEYASHISRAGHNLLGVVSDVLDISRIESGAFKLEKSLSNVGDLVADAADAVAELIAAKGQTLDVKVATGLPLIDFDYKRMRRVLGNLLSNASKFSPEGGQLVMVATTESSRDITIAVADNGIGMAQEQIDYALKPFAQLDSNYSRQQEGTGLGLPITKALIELHGGRLFLSSTPGVGTMAAFTLPRDAGDATLANQPKSFLFRRD